MEHQQGSGFCQRPVLAAHLALQLFVSGLQITQCRGCLALRDGVVRTCCTEVLVPLLQLMLEQALLAAPRVQRGTRQGVALVERQKALWGAPLGRRNAVRQFRRMRRNCRHSTLHLEPALERAHGQIEFIGDGPQRALSALPGLAQRLFLERC